MSDNPLSRISATAEEDAVGTPKTTPKAELPFDQRLEKAIGVLARAFVRSGGPYSGAYSPGDVAQLRRLDHRRGHASATPAFWRVVVHELEEAQLLGPEAGESSLRPWMAILQGLATVRELHRAKFRLGKAISQAGISEARLNRLLQARGDMLLNQIRPLAHQLRSQAQPVNWAEVAKLVLSDGKPWADNVRQRVASSYYRSQARQN